MSTDLTPKEIAEADREARRLVYAATSEELSALGYVMAALALMPQADLLDLVSEASASVRRAGADHNEGLTVYWAHLGLLAWTAARRRGVTPETLAGHRPEPEQGIGQYL